MVWTLTNLRTSVDLSSRASDVKIAQRAYAETSRCTAKIDNEDGTVSILSEDEIVVMDGATKAFQGYVRIRERSDREVSTQLVYDVELQDYTTALGDDYAPLGSVRSTVESDKARIAWLGSTFGTRGLVFSGTTIVQLRASMPEQDFSGLTLHECLTLICSITGGSFYVDYDKVLHYFSSEVLSAPFGLSDAPNGSTTFDYVGLRLRDDTVAYLNEVLVIGDGVSSTRYLGGSAPAAGTRRATVLRDSSLLTTADCDAAGDALIANYGGARQPSEITVYRPGLRAGMTVQITHAGYGLSAATYRIASIEATAVDRDRIAYQVFLGSNPLSFESLMRQADQAVANLRATAEDVASSQITADDLSVGGGNIIPNSSFEDGTSWTPGTSWVIGFDPTSPQEAFQGTDVARWTPSATQGTLVTPLLPVARSAEYWFSAYVFCRAFTSGRLRMLVEEYNSSNVLLATTQVGPDITAVSAEWTRLQRKFAPAAGVGVTGWQTTTAKIRLVFGPQGTNTTGTFDVDGVQGERGGVITAYAPAPYEITAASIGTTQIADDAITTPKIAAAQIVAAKIASGTITGGLIAANTITSDKLSVGGSGQVQIDATGIYLNATGGIQGVITAAGFGGSFDDFLRSGIYNDTFAYGTLGTLTNGSNALPYWNVGKVGSTGWATVYEADTAIGSGRRIRATATAGSGALTDELNLEQVVAITEGFPRIRGSRLLISLYGKWVSGTADSSYETVFTQYKSDKTTVVGTATTVAMEGEFGAVGTPWYWRAAIDLDPLTAFVAVKIRVKRITALTAWEHHIYAVEAQQSINVLMFSGGPSGTGSIYGQTIYGPQVVGTARGLSIFANGQYSEGAIEIGKAAAGGALYFSHLTNERLELPGAGNVHARSTDFRVPDGVLGMKTNAGSPTDAQFLSGNPTNGGMIWDTTNTRLWVRNGAANWDHVIFTSERIPGDEYRCPECWRPIEVGDEAVCVVDHVFDDDAILKGRHMFWKHRRHGFGWELLKLLRLVDPVASLQRFRAMIEDEDARRRMIDARMQPPENVIELPARAS